jgi:phosphatidylserine/phosphatidylglycerophosphate/cardiolipin synthase-like enzyme
VLLAIALSVPTARGSPAANDRQHFAAHATYQTCFTPGDDGEGLIEQAINAAIRQIHVQAYLFTDRNIARALEDARRRGLDVIVLLDKRQRRDPDSVAPELAQAGVEVMFDDQPRIAHNKTFVIDPDGPDPVVETGSYNFTYSAERRNAENALLVRDDPAFAAAYERYFQERLAAAHP